MLESWKILDLSLVLPLPSCVAWTSYILLQNFHSVVLKMGMIVVLSYIG